jgi:3-hydroxyisobutyrate dehydrogenase-like beta-hydroxyacid dehydrogenase
MRASALLEPKVAIVIGAGLAGLKAALKLAVQGMRVSVFERQPVPSSSTPSIYAKLLRFPGVRVAGGVEVVDMWVLPNRHAVRGVRAVLYGREHGEFFGDLVIDATKSPSRFDQWRGAEGFACVNEIDRVLEKGSRGAA